MQCRFILGLTLTVIATAITQTSSLFTNPFSLPSFGRGAGVMKNGASKLFPNIEGGVRQMQIKNPFYSTLLRGKPVGNVMAMPNLEKGPRLPNSFNWTSCGASNQIFDIKALTLKPSPLSFPGTLTFSFDIVFHDNIEKGDNVSAAIKLEYLTGSTWLKIPCLGNIGSCTYSDLCGKLAGLSCPSDITKQGVKCNCPISKGEYKLQPYSVEVDAEVFINGNYRAVANFTSATKGAIGCYKMAFTIM